MDYLPKEVLYRRTFTVELMKPSYEEGESLSPKVSYSVLLGPDRIYVQHFIQTTECETYTKLYL